MIKPKNFSPQSLANNPRASSDAWFRFRSVVEAAYNSHPKPFRTNIQGLSTNTAASRIRDAVRGCIAFKYECSIPHDELYRWWSEIVVRFTPGELIIGPPDAPSEPAPLTFSSAPTTNEIVMDTPSLESVLAAHRLIAEGHLKLSVRIIHPPDLSVLPPHPNVQILPRSDGTVVLL